MEPVTRRRLLATSVGVSVPGYAGCLGRGSESDEEPPPGRIEGDPPNVPSKLECSDGALRNHCREANTTSGDCDDPDYNRHVPVFDESSLQWGDEAGLGWQMEVDDTEFHPGDEVTITMRNVSDEVKHYGASTKYNLQVFTEAGRTFVSCRAGTVDLVVPTDTKTSARANRPAAPNGGRSRSTLMPRRISGVPSQKDAIDLRFME